MPYLSWSEINHLFVPNVLMLYLLVLYFLPILCFGIVNGFDLI